MKRFFFFIISSAVILFPGCTKDNDDILPPLIENTEDDYFVDINSVNALFQYSDSETRGLSSSSRSSTSSFIFRNETVFYIVNHPNNQGWKIISSDRRTPPVLAESPRGSFSMGTDNPGLLAWMVGVAEDMFAIRHAENVDLSFSEEEISANIRFWSREPSRSLDPHPEDDGEWAGTTTTITEVVDSIPHLTTTQWHQKDPYNRYCPLRTDIPTERAPAGCNAIAGSQMLYFLHEKWGIPQYMESKAYVSGYVGSGNYIMTQWYPSNTVWGDMIATICPNGCSSHDHVEGVMIARVGCLLGSQYGNEGTSASLHDLVEDVFNQYGIDCDYGSYSETAVRNSLISGFPVIIGASSQWYPNWDFTIPSHSFLIDGYKRTRVKTTTHFVFVPNDPDNYDPSSHPSYDVITYSNPIITSIKMNWGWWTQWFTNAYNPDYLNDGWYTLTGDWIVDVDEDELNYHYYRKMINNFSIIQ